MSQRELQLLLRLRTLAAGGYMLYVHKTQRGRDGLEEWRVIEGAHLTDGKNKR